MASTPADTVTASAESAEEEATTSTTVATATAPTTTAPTTSAPSTTAAELASTGEEFSAFCVAKYKIDDIFARMDDLYPASADVMEAALIKIHELQELSPPRHSDEMALWVQAFTEMQTILEGNDYDVPASAAAIAAVQIALGLDENPEDGLQSYMAETCTASFEEALLTFSGDSDSGFCVQSRLVGAVEDDYPEMTTDPAQTRDALAEVAALLTDLELLSPPEIASEIAFARSAFVQLAEDASDGTTTFEELLDNGASDYQSAEMERVGEVIDAYNTQVCDTSW